MKVYLIELVGMLEMSISQFYIKLNELNTTNKQNEYITETLNQYDLNLGGRPCLDNAIEELMNTIMNPGFMWKGKNKPINFWKSNNIEYFKNIVLAPAIMSYYRSKQNENLNKFKKLCRENKMNEMWGVFSKKPIYTRTDPTQVPTFWNLKNINRLSNINIKKITTNTMENYVNFMGVNNYVHNNSFNEL